MAISSGGMFGPHKGKVGSVVYYIRKGKQVARAVGVNTKPASEAQKKNRLEMAITNSFCKKVLPFIKYGFAQQIAGTDLSQSNVAVSQIKLNALKGEYPDISIDYEKVVLSSGPLLRGEQITTQLEVNGIRFNWYTETEIKWPDSSDQVMLMAYLPEEDRAIYQLFGAVRTAGTDLLAISEPLLDKYIETYVAFISADRNKVSDSVYTGSFNKPVNS